MAEIEKVSEADRLEQANLERVVADVERTLLASPPGTRPFFNGFLMNAKARLGVLDKKIHDEEREKEQQKSNEVAIVQLAEKESALNANEKEEYSGFLKEDFFTKKDFARLDHFYAHCWDRLSERGKDEMSKRVWEGVRKNEYKFTDLPKDVQEKEERQAYRMLNPQVMQSNAPQIPQQDRQDFIKAYQSGNREEAAKVLNKDCFKQSLFRSDASAAITHAAVRADAKAVLSSAYSDPAPVQKIASPQNDAIKKLDVSGVDLSSLQLADGKVQPPTVNLADSGSVRSH